MTSLAVKLAVVRELENRIKELKTSLNEEFLALLEPGDAKGANLDDGVRIGKVMVVSGRVTLSVTNEAALTAWVKENHPSEIVETVRDSFKAALLNRAKDSGELIPGMDLRIGNPYVSYRAEPGAADVIAARWKELASEVLKIEGPQ
jgi:hypothetical protein